MPISGASVLLLLAGAHGIDLAWPPAIDCPDREQVLSFLDALLKDDVQAIIRTSTAPPDRLELAIEHEGRTVNRAIVLVGECDRRAATVAAVIERVLTAGVAPARTATIAIDRSEPLPSEARARVGSIGGGAHGAIGIDGELGFGFDLEGVWWVIDPIGLGLRAAVRWPEVEPVAEGDVRIDQLRADLLVLFAILDDLAIEGRLFGQMAWAESRRIATTRRAFKFNPGAGVGVTYRFPIDPIEVSLAVRTLIPFRSQRFLVDGAEVARLPSFQIEGAVGVSYAF